MTSFRQTLDPFAACDSLAGDIAAHEVRLAAIEGLSLAAKEVTGVAAGYKIARGVHQQAAASDNVDTGLTTVVAVVASFRDSPTGKQMLVSAAPATVGGSPDLLSYITIKTFALGTSGSPDTLVVSAATDFTDNLNIEWVAIGT